MMISFDKFLVAHFVIVFVVAESVEKPVFRILAPQFVCPKDEDALIEKPDGSVIMLQTKAGVELSTRWTVRWKPLEAPSQRLTLMIWRAVRALEAKMNGPHPVPHVFVVDNSQLLQGVEFIFNVTATSSDGIEGDPKTFSIVNSQGGKKLEVEGRADKFSVNILGSQVVYADVDFVVEAQVTTCQPTEDYHFRWSAKSLDSAHEVDVSREVGSRLVVPAKSLKADVDYVLKCQVIRTSNDDFLTQSSLPFQVIRRGLEVQLSADHQLVSVGTAFSISAAVFNHDFFEDEPSFQWTCLYEDEPCDFFESLDVNELKLESGMPAVGLYKFGLKITVKDESGFAQMSVSSVESNLPVLQIDPVSRIQNQGSIVALVANASNVAPSCSLTWYFANKESLASDPEKHGEALTVSLTIQSLEENFLFEISDFHNETEWRQVTAEVSALPGRARFVAECGCSLTFSCEAEGVVYADIFFEVNESPVAGAVMISPVTGIALETIFRISTLAAVDPDIPLSYYFYCSLGGDSTLLLAFYYEHLSVETFLPYVEGGTEVWVEVCDARGSCSKGPRTLVHLSKGEGHTVTALIEAARGHLRRCEIMMLHKVAVSAITTYKTAGPTEAFDEFSEAMNSILSGDPAETCDNLRNGEYMDFLNYWFGTIAVRT